MANKRPPDDLAGLMDFELEPNVSTNVDLAEKQSN
jgi:hypothetical protein